MTEVTTFGPKTLIVSNNVIEADDLTEMLTDQGLGPVLHARDLDDASKVLTEAGNNLKLVMCGLSLHLHEVNEFLAEINLPGLSLVVIDGPAEFSEREGAGVLLRPFSTRDVMAALSRLGLPN
ncbi:MAG: hypothetical protein ACEPO2_03560 [Pelagibaca sp.]